MKVQLQIYCCWCCDLFIIYLLTTLLLKLKSVSQKKIVEILDPAETQALFACTNV